MPGASTMRSAASTVPVLSLTLTPTGSMLTTSPSTTFTPYLLIRVVYLKSRLAIVRCPVNTMLLMMFDV